MPIGRATFRTDGNHPDGIWWWTMTVVGRGRDPVRSSGVKDAKEEVKAAVERCGIVTLSGPESAHRQAWSKPF